MRLLKFCLFIILVSLLISLGEEVKAKLIRLTNIEVSANAEDIEISLITCSPIKKYSVIGDGDIYSPINIFLENTLNDWLPLVRLVDHKLVKKISSVQLDGGVTQVIIELRKPVVYNVTDQGNMIKVRLRERVGERKAPEVSYEIVNVEVNNISKHEAKVIIHTSGYPNIKYFQAPDSITIHFLNAMTQQITIKPGEEMIKSIYFSQVQDKLVQGIIQFQHPSSAQVLIIEPNQVHVNIIREQPSLKQPAMITSPVTPEVTSETVGTISTSDVEFTQELSETSRPLPLTTMTSTTSITSQVPLITNVFYEVDIRQALRDISSQAEIPIIIDDTVRGVVNLELKDVPLEEALRMILLPGGYTFKKYNNYYLVGSPHPMNPAFKEFVTFEEIELDYLKAEDIPQLLSEDLSPFIHVNRECNKLAVTATPETIARIKRYINILDTPPPQICIEALVTEIYLNKGKESGIDWNLNWKNIASFSDNNQLKYTITSENTRQGLLNFINFLIKEGKGEIKANPRVVTLESKPAVIYIGREEYHQLASGYPGYGYTRLESIKIGISLKITPYLAKNGDITVKIESEVGDVTGEVIEKLPITNRRVVNTQVRVKDGETIVIGGLIQKNKVKEKTRWPILGRIPVLGFFFSRTNYTVRETETVVFITPRVVR